MLGYLESVRLSNSINLEGMVLYGFSELRNKKFVALYLAHAKFSSLLLLCTLPILEVQRSQNVIF